MDCSPPGSLPMEFSRQEYWSRLPFPTPGDLSNPGIKPEDPVAPAEAGGFFTTEPPGKPMLGLWVLAKLLDCVPFFWDYLDCSPPGSSVHGIFQARILEWVAISYPRISFSPRDQTRISCVSCIGRWFLYHWATWEVQRNKVENWSVWEYGNNLPGSLYIRLRISAPV